MDNASSFTGARVVTVMDPVVESHTAGVIRYNGYVRVRECGTGMHYVLLDGAINAAPESLHKVGVECELGWLDLPSGHVPYIIPKGESHAD